MYIRIAILFIVSSCQLLSQRSVFNHTCQLITHLPDVEITRDGKLAFVQCVTDINVIDIPSGQSIQKLLLNISVADFVQSMMVTDNQSALIIATVNNVLQTWHRKQQNRFQFYQETNITAIYHTRNIRQHQNKDLMYVLGQSSVVLYNLTNMQVVPTGYNQTVRALNLLEAPKYDILYVSSYELFGLQQIPLFSVNIIDRNTFKLKQSMTFSGAQRFRMTLSRDQEKMAVVMHQSGQINIFDRTVKKELARLEGHHNMSSYAVFSWNDQIVMSFAADEQLILWNASNYLEIQRFNVGFGGNGLQLSCDSHTIVVSGEYHTAVIDIADPSLFGSCTDAQVFSSKANLSQYLLFALLVASFVQILYFGHTDTQSTTILFVILLLNSRQHSFFFPILHHNPYAICGVLYSLLLFLCLCLTITLQWHPKPTLLTILKKLYNCCVLLTLPLLFDNLSRSASPTDEIYGILISGLLTGIMLVGTFNNSVCRVFELMLRITYYLCVCQLIAIEYIDQLFLLHIFYLILLTAITYRWNKKAFQSNKLAVLYVLQVLCEIPVLAMWSQHRLRLLFLCLGFIFSIVSKALYCHKKEQGTGHPSDVEMRELRPQQSSNINISNLVSELR